MEKKWAFWAGLHGFCAVALGAFAAHALKAVLDPEALGWVETGARYQMYHALALLALAALGGRLQGKAARASGWGFALGPLIFSGSLYLMALSGQRWLGAVTPLGGLLMLAGWLSLAISFSKSPLPPPESPPPA
jgi:uncharacterized membrane protein YgdD (TMEM256/DUF423 family)